MIKLDYSINDPEKRIVLAESILSHYEPSASELVLLTDYVLFVRDKNQTKKERKEEYPITTPNREVTLEKRQISYDGLAEKLENGEDGLYSLISNDKEIKLDNKDPITPKDIKEIPGIKDSMDIIASFEKQYEKATGSKRKTLKTAIIETWKQIYTIKSDYKISASFSTNKTKYLAYIDIPEEIEFDERDIPYSNSPLSLLNPEHVSFLLQYYQPLKEETWELLDSDMRWHLIDLEELAAKALEQKYPLLWDVLIWKVDKLTNKQIKEKVLAKYGEDHSEQYYSSIWRKRIPKLISEQAQKRYLITYCLRNKVGYWKRCSKCGRLKLGNPLFFSKNSGGDNFYSQCKECRNSKK